MVDHRSRLESFRYFDSQRAQFLEVRSVPTRQFVKISRKLSDARQELLAELTKTQDELKQVKLDLVSETEARRKWQEELKELKGLGNEKVSYLNIRKSRFFTSSNQYAVVLIDGDSDGYIVSVNYTYTMLNT